MRRRCAICGIKFKTSDPEQTICPDCEVVEELIEYESDDNSGEIIGKSFQEPNYRR